MQKRKNPEAIKKLVGISILVALVAILAYFGGFIKIGGLASISLTLIPVVLGAALYGPWYGALLGSAAGAVFFLTPDAAYWLGLSIPGTIITVMVKGFLSGLCAGLVFDWLKRFNGYLAIIASAVVCPVVNTGVFLLGCLTFFMDTVRDGAAKNNHSVAAYLIVFFIGLNFVFELITNIVLSPAILRIIRIVKKDKTTRIVWDR